MPLHEQIHVSRFNITNLCLWLRNMLQSKPEENAVQCQSRHCTELSLGNFIHMHSWLLCYCNLPLMIAVYYNYLLRLLPSRFDNGNFISLPLVNNRCSIRNCTQLMAHYTLCRKKNNAKRIDVITSNWCQNLSAVTLLRALVIDQWSSATDAILCCVHCLVIDHDVMTDARGYGCVHSSFSDVWWLVSPVGCRCIPSSSRSGW